MAGRTFSWTDTVQEVEPGSNTYDHRGSVQESVSVFALGRGDETFSVGETVRISGYFGIRDFEATYLGTSGRGIVVFYSESAGGQTASETLYFGDAPLRDGPITVNPAPYVVCYLRGTLILTDKGEVPIEELSEGDMLVTRFGGLRPIRWIGRQSVAGPAARGQEPIRIAPGALGEGMPRRPLLVSPGHSMLVGETLVLAQDLVNGATITREAPGQAWDYVQVEFDSHDCVLAEGAWSESFADCGTFRRRFDNAAEFHARFPGHAAPDQPQLCAPRPEAGRALEAALRAPAERAASGMQPGPLAGFVESVATPCRVTGWAADAAHPELPVLLEIVLDGTVLGTALACHRRDDVSASGQGPSRAGFAFEGDRLLTTAEQQRLVVRRAQDGRVLGETDPMPLEGHLDRVASPCRLEGWARDPSRPGQPAMLEVVLGTRVLGTVQACRYRQDLADAGLGNAAFVFEAGFRLSAEDMAAIQLRRVGDGAVLRRTKGTRQDQPAEALALAD